MGFGVLTFCSILLCASLSCLLSLANGACNSDALALYKVTFEGLWTKARFPKVYPELRPKAEWSSIIGRSHSQDYSLFSKGKAVSESVQSFIEYGETTRLDGEGQGHPSILDSFTSPPLERGYGVSQARFFADSDRYKVSFIAKILPSPDWFVGLDSVSLCEDETWAESAEFDLWPLDAGTQQGYTFSSPRWRSDPQEVITEITNLFPNRTADAFYYPQLSTLPPIAKVKLSLEKLYTKANVGSTVALIEQRHTTPMRTYLRAAVKEEKPGTLLKPPVLLLTRNNMRLRLTTLQPTPLTAHTPAASRALGVGSFSSTTPTTTLREGITTHSNTVEGDVTKNTLVSIKGTTTAVINKKIMALLKSMKSTENRPKTVSARGQLVDRLANRTPSFKVTRIVPDFTDDELDGLEEEKGSGLEVTPIVISSSTSSYVTYGAREDSTTSTVTTESYISNDILPPDYEHDRMFEAKVCLVSGWSEWSTCSRTCGYGSKIRTRNVTKWTGNVPCPDLQMDQLCGSMKKCNWNHFSLRFNSTKSILGHKKRIRQKKPIQITKTGQNNSTEEGTAAALRGSSGSWRSRTRVAIGKS